MAATLSLVIRHDALANRGETIYGLKAHLDIPIMEKAHPPLTNSRSSS
jgi:hypothetical protein